jgi:hypothetical protein
MTSWQQKLKDENIRLSQTIVELRTKIAIQEREIEILRKYSQINPDLSENIGKVVATMGESLHSMSNFLDTVERIKR